MTNMLSTEQMQTVEDIAKANDGKWLEVSYWIRCTNGNFEFDFFSVMPVKEKKEWE